jgi:protein-tyrosine kinase
MASSPRSSLVERLVQDRLRSGNLEASTAQLLQLGDDAATTAPPPLTPGPLNPGPLNPGPLSPGPAAPPLVNGLNGDHAAQPLTLDPAKPRAAPIALPMALELRPLTQAAPAALIPTLNPGLAPSGLVPAPATALPVSGSASIAQPREPGPVAQPISHQEPEPQRPDLVQGPPTIDAVALERGGMVDWSRTRSRISEEFRLVQRQILRAAFGPGAEPGFSNLLMVTSARPGEGKSFTSVNLAGSIARQGDHHVLLVDADSKRDSFCYALGLAEMRGLLDLVANPKLDPSPLIVKTPIDRLSILPVGRERERSAELFSTKEMTRLIQSLGRRYADRLLVLDAPPCLSTSDPAVLAPVVGQILFVVEADRTQRDEVEASLDLIQACPNITLVLNKQQISSRYTFGAYSSYYSS